MSAVNVRGAVRRSVVDAHAERCRQRQELEDQVAALAIEVNVALASCRPPWRRRNLTLVRH